VVILFLPEGYVVFCFFMAMKRENSRQTFPPGERWECRRLKNIPGQVIIFILFVSRLEMAISDGFSNLTWQNPVRPIAIVSSRSA